MKRSEINLYIRQAMAFMDKNRFFLPHWAHWTPEQWATKGEECNEIRHNALGWDITDFGSGDFKNTGLTLVTLRNGNLSDGKKVYCEKIMYVRDSQITPLHFHWHKTEDIINRAGGKLCMRLWKADANEALSEEPLTIQIDGVTTPVKAGEVIKIEVGQSVCYEPYVYHAFWAEGGDCLVGEVSTVNDDKNDNRFLKNQGRFPAIDEDEKIEHLLCNEYPA